MQTILIVEDEKRVADLLKIGLEENGYQTMVAYDGAMGLRLFQSNSFQLVISDIILPKLDGFELCKEIRKVNERIPILMLTALGSADVKVLLKRNAETVVRPPEQITYADLSVNLNLREVTRNNIAIKLSPKEYNLLLYMLENAEKVITRVEIAEKVWNTHFDTGTNFIDVYINYLRKKIDKNFGKKLIHTKPGVGFILSDKL